MIQLFKKKKKQTGSFSEYMNRVAELAKIKGATYYSFKVGMSSFHDGISFEGMIENSLWHSGCQTVDDLLKAIESDFESSEKQFTIKEVTI